ncbi:hypothetical protein SAMN04490188_4622 [Pseudomonas kilonensis]|uniref:Uncharacterized protein n=1 Tax=Pseudomonas kilonensis TaxID=132476 RepID=A0ABY0ZFE0_9PSED|nr:hypothetical protein SAMN04490188_4622 [Pseudomonas kilonensis]
MVLGSWGCYAAQREQAPSPQKQRSTSFLSTGAPRGEGACSRWTAQQSLDRLYHPDYYGAYFRDFDGNKLCVCCHDSVST